MGRFLQCLQQDRRRTELLLKLSVWKCVLAAFLFVPLAILVPFSADKFRVGEA
jgi:hypothetical protein